MPAAQARTADGLSLPPAEPSVSALPLPEDRGEAALEQTLKRLGTTASVMMIVAHPDDEDGALLTYLSRGLGVRATFLTLTRGEGGQNAMSGDTYDALGIIRTNELLNADEYYGVKQLWGTEADFGFSKTQEEAFSKWGHERVLYDAVLAVRRERPQVIVSTFIGGITDGHGQHQVSGEIAQEVFKAAADPKVFPEQLKDGLAAVAAARRLFHGRRLRPSPNKGMFDYATGKWAPARIPQLHHWRVDHGRSVDRCERSGRHLDQTLGRSYAQIAREGWGEQKSQNGGANPTLSGPATASYHLWAVAPAAQTHAPANSTEADKAGTDLFHNSKVNIDTSIEGLAHLVHVAAPAVALDGSARNRRKHPAARVEMSLQRRSAGRAGARADLSADACSSREGGRKQSRSSRPATGSCSNSTPRSTVSSRAQQTCWASTSSPSGPTKLDAQDRGIPRRLGR